MILLLTLAMIVYVSKGFSLSDNYFSILMQQNQVVLSTDVAYFPEFSISAFGSQINLINQIPFGIP